jgi:hypothetical protein
VKITSNHASLVRHGLEALLRGISCLVKYTFTAEVFVRSGTLHVFGSEIEIRFLTSVS